MKYSFFCFGHKNLISLHKTTVEFTKDAHLTINGDCIAGINADFSYGDIMAFVQENSGRRIRCTLKLDDLEDSFSFVLNPNFTDKEEMVIRRSDYSSDRTLGILSTKSAIDLNRKLINKMKNPKIKMEVIFESEKKDSS